MFQKLHRQMTLFCTLATGGIFLVLTAICLLFAENSLKQSGYQSFLLQLNSILIHLEEEDEISHQWLSQLQGNGQCLLFLYDNGKPLSYQDYYFSEEEIRLAGEAIAAAGKNQDTDLFSGIRKDSQLIHHAQYRFVSSDHQDFHASIGVIPKKNGRLGFLLLFPLKKQQTQLIQLRLVVCLADLAAVLLLFLFSRHFTGRMLVPLKENQKRQTLFIASASHELRSPLAVLRSGLEVLQKTDSPAEQAHFIHLMEEESAHMQHLVNQMLLLASTDSNRLSEKPKSHNGGAPAPLPLQMAPCPPDTLLLTVFEKYEPLAAKKKISLAVDLPEEPLPDCLCDSEKIQQAFSILLDNALSYTPQGGSVRLSLVRQKSSLVFSFADTGRGIPDGEKELIFERFYRSGNRADKGHFGLGLCIAKEIVCAHSGKIWAEDHAPVGSRFYVSLPTSQA